jgi:polyisoprenoid-binding protein YceI
MSHQPDRAPSAEARDLEETVRLLLVSDHEHLEWSFQAIVNEAWRGDPADLGERWRSFERELLAHLATEEEDLIRLFGEVQPIEARELMAEHQQIRITATEMGIDLDLHCLRAARVQAFIDQLRAHAQREEQLLYPWATQRLGEAAAQRIRRLLVARRKEAQMRTKRDDWRVDPEHSSLRFSLRHIVISEIGGSFGRWGGTVDLDEIDPTKSSVRVWVDLASIDTGNPERDQHVCSSEFFDVASFPRATFESTEIRLDGPTPVVRGRLDLHGVQVALDLEVVDRRRTTDASGLDRVIYEVTGRMDRRDFGLRWNQDLDLGGIVVGDEIRIVAHVESVRVTH